ncbi:hypothetical protein KM043_011499 [Ampulex compressa]|nr:hypothetical protein KM043_011499 [Ampulex compressa]
MDPAKLKVVELRAQLSQRGLDSKGNKAVLVERLRKALEDENASRSPNKSATNPPNADDTVSKENNEKVVEPVKSVQPPKTPGRSSRSSSMTTPTKISTRNALRASLTPNSLRQSSSDKSQNIETLSETLETVAESVTEEAEPLKQEKDASLPVMVQDSEETLASTDSKNVSVISSPGKVQEDPKDVETVKEDSSDISSSKVNLAVSPEKSEIVQEKPLENPISNIDDEYKEDEEYTAAQEEALLADEDGMEENNDTAEIMNTDKEQVCSSDIISEEPKDEETESKVEVVDDVQSAKDADNINQPITDVESQKLIDDTNKSEEKMGDDELDVEMNALNEANDDQANVEIDSQMEVDKDDDNTIEEKNKDDAELTDPKCEQGEKLEGEDWEDKGECKNRKRKRSPSPATEHRISPIPIKTENEPEIDNSLFILSWYDSDLNLIIDKDNFSSATPMHNDDFCYIWAGARASHGFVSGKVYYEVKISEYCQVNMQDEQRPHLLRIGWSVPYSSMQLGEEKLSYGYDTAGKKLTDKEFIDYGPEFSKDDIVGCYLDATSDNDATVSYTVNGKDLGMAFTIAKQELENKPLFPHVLSKNCTFACNFGQEEPWAEVLEGYVAVGNTNVDDKIPGPCRPEKAEECEIIMMCGLPACGKTTLALKYAAEYPHKMYNVLGISSLMNKIKEVDTTQKQNYHSRWEVLADKCTRALNKLIEVASSRRRNYILDQTNVYPSAQKRKMKNFNGYNRKAVIVVPTEEEFKSRIAKRKEEVGNEVPDTVLMEMKANFTAPVPGEFFDSVDWVELNEEDGRKLIEKYNKEGKDAGFGIQPVNKRQRTDKPDGNKEFRDVRPHRDNRDTRDHRDRRNNYPDRNRNPAWRGGTNMGWRDRPQRGGHNRHGSSYGPPIPWRGRGAPIPPLHRGMDRRGGSGDRRTNDRNRSGMSRQSGWGPMSNYQGSQQSGWSQQGNWSSGQSTGGWGQQGNWGPQQWSNWKGYGQGSYNQTNYSQQGYGNGNWNSWNQQYYNQYWNQQQPSGQTTTAGGGQAESAMETVTTSSIDSGTPYSYPQEWQGYSQEYTSSTQSGATNAQRSQRHK